MEGGSIIEHISKEFYRRNEAALLKGVPLLFGYLIFFIYFIRNGFFPSVDFFGFISITLSAFLIGVAVFFYIQMFIWFGAWVWVDTVFSDSKYKKHINMWMLKNGERNEDFFKFKLGVKRLLVPLFVFQVLFGVFIYRSKFGLVDVSVAIAVGLAIPIFCAFWHVYRLNIPQGDMPSFMFSYVLVFLISMLSSILAMISISESYTYSYLQCVSLGCAVSFFSTFFSFISQSVKSWKAFLLRAVTFLFVFFSAGMYLYIPDKIVASMGLGNFYAEKIVLKDDYCKMLTLQYPSVVSCALDNVHIIWGEGETLKVVAPLQYAYENNEQQRSEACLEKNSCSQSMRVPRDAIAAIIE